MSCSNKDLIHYYLNDPSKKDFIAQVAVPENPPWKLRVKGYKGPGHDPASIAGQAAICYVTLANALNYIVPRIPDGPKRWAAVRELLVLPRAGKDFNAFYNRKYLKFFHDKNPETKKIVFTCEAADIVAHELGHAVLDAIRPDFWNVQGKEGWAFHESFGDIMAVLSILQHEKVLNHAIQIDLNKSNVVSRLAEEMAAAVYALAKGKGGVRVDDDLTWRTRKAGPDDHALRCADSIRPEARAHRFEAPRITACAGQVLGRVMMRVLDLDRTVDFFVLGHALVDVEAVARIV